MKNQRTTGQHRASFDFNRYTMPVGGDLCPIDAASVESLSTMLRYATIAERFGKSAVFSRWSLVKNSRKRNWSIASNTRARPKNNRLESTQRLHSHVFLPFFDALPMLTARPAMIMLSWSGQSTFFNNSGRMPFIEDSVYDRIYCSSPSIADLYFGN